MKSLLTKRNSCDLTVWLAHFLSGHKRHLSLLQIAVPVQHHYWTGKVIFLVILTARTAVQSSSWLSRLILPIQVILAFVCHAKSLGRRKGRVGYVNNFDLGPEGPFKYASWKQFNIIIWLYSIICASLARLSKPDVIEQGATTFCRLWKICLTAVCALQPCSSCGLVQGEVANHWPWPRASASSDQIQKGKIPSSRWPFVLSSSSRHSIKTEQYHITSSRTVFHQTQRRLRPCVVIPADPKGLPCPGLSWQPWSCLIPVKGRSKGNDRALLYVQYPTFCQNCVLTIHWLPRHMTAKRKYPSYSGVSMPYCRLMSCSRSCWRCPLTVGEDFATLYLAVHPQLSLGLKALPLSTVMHLSAECLGQCRLIHAMLSAFRLPKHWIRSYICGTPINFRFSCGGNWSMLRWEFEVCSVSWSLQFRQWILWTSLTHLANEADTCNCALVQYLLPSVSLVVPTEFWNHTFKYSALRQLIEWAFSWPAEPFQGLSEHRGNTGGYHAKALPAENGLRGFGEHRRRIPQICCLAVLLQGLPISTWGWASKKRRRCDTPNFVLWRLRHHKDPCAGVNLDLMPAKVKSGFYLHADDSDCCIDKMLL